MEVTKGINAIPAGASRTLYSAYPAFSHVIDTTSEQILGIVSKVLSLQDIKGNIQRLVSHEILSLFFYVK